ncbi:serine/threonine-protein kinase [Chloracidobacterium aggregatum]|jgi:serine/threonine protein kinase|uniref:Serine/threonine protein kinase n=1 Tax=Chloracidobacterium sp. N TaxID=2821540 RepID=A0ABX8AYM6_9BACT|nr:serine/threonine-protein kinase [Chloracidobacterium aggregatum]QUV83809.1 serine/threonine protein kinase [Chloracidobacterium sp. 2]QUV87713.1 serine/threonine protein kinase [Chloracidobacterium sp. S]QUV90611.1 serine/threonine protein kinase [Chloracidobacterium sp. A]QUV93823.1 serine/threonine protein kinase [Chloracidobacterium sp. N]
MKRCVICGKEFHDQMRFCPFDGGALETIEQDAFIGQTLDGKYRIEAKIGEGGMGAVYRARHVLMDTHLAIKVLHPSLVSDATSVARFQREAQAMARIRHSNAIAVTDFGVTEDQINYIVMELFEGESLRKVLEREKKLPYATAIAIARQVCGALEAAHRSGVIHRDIKPENIFLSPQPDGSYFVKVIDFGIAKIVTDTSQGGPPLTRQGMIIGSPHYLSPEQCTGQELDARSDIYSLGIVLFEMLTGQVPFTAVTPVAVALLHANEPPPSLRKLNPEIPKALDDLVMSALAKSKADRPASAREFAEELARVARLVSPSFDPVTPLVEKILDASLTPSNGAPPLAASPVPPPSTVRQRPVERRPASTPPSPAPVPSAPVPSPSPSLAPPLPAAPPPTAGTAWDGSSLATYGQSSADSQLWLRWVVAAVVVFLVLLVALLMYLFS